LAVNNKRSLLLQGRVNLFLLDAQLKPLPNQLEVFQIAFG
jgi:hypothetical protein